MPSTVLDQLLASIDRAMIHNAHDEPPVALLWPDEHGHWESIIERLAEERPIVTLSDDYDPARRRGPGIWVRCVVAGTVDVGLPEGKTIVYLPGHARSEIRAVDHCPEEIAPVAELQYRSKWFAHPKARDWSPRALFRDQQDGLGLDIAGDEATNQALQLALPAFLNESYDRVVGQYLDADYFLALVNPDLVRTLLRWIENPNGARDRMGDAEFDAFVQRSVADLGFDPSVDGDITACRKLARRQGKWADAWQRFAEAPGLYPGLADQLRKARPDELIVDDRDVWPQENERDEEQLRARLLDLATLVPNGARNEISRLESEHSWRRTTVWAEMDCAPLAMALEQLVVLADITNQSLSSGSLSSLTDDYTSRGWRADDALLRALAAVQAGPDREAVGAAASSVYRSWLDDGARALQQIIGPLANNHTYQAGAAASDNAGTITVFVDGLRYDLAERLREQLADAGTEPTLTNSLAALPTVTETSKPALVPLPVGALVAGDELKAARPDGVNAAIGVLRTLLTDAGVQVLDASELGDPGGTAWTEAGQVDHFGHDTEVDVVDRLDAEIASIAGRIRALLAAGWQRVEVVTDHGWILLPGGMEKVELPAAIVDKKKGRCARLKEGAPAGITTVPWYWDQDVRIAIAPGATCFTANKQYEHGGVSPQECIVPRLSVVSGATSTSTGGPEIRKVEWRGLRCRIELAHVVGDVIADLRRQPTQAETSVVAASKETTTDGQLSLLVTNEELDGERVHLVLLDRDGKLLAQREVIIGRNR
jgi:hypothetical protein